MWNARKSVLLSLIACYLCCVLLLAFVFLAPTALRWYYGAHTEITENIPIILAAFYVCCPAAAAALSSLIRLLRNIRLTQIFTAQNVSLLRILSWCCCFVTFVTLIAGWWYLPFYIVSVAAGFFTLILRVVKNVMAAASALKEENDMTI